MARKQLFPVLLAAAALAFHLFAGFSFIRASAATYDETVHLASGYSYLHTGRYVMNIMDHPPFSEMLSALPLLALKPQAFAGHPYFANFMPYHYGDLFLYQNTVPHERLLNTARGFTFLVWTAVLAGLLWLLMSRLESPAAAAFSLCAFAGMPVFISNHALVSTDAAASAFYFGAFALGWLFTAEPPGGRKGEKGGRPWLWAALAGAVSGLALVSKFSMFIVPPLVAAFWLADNHFWPRMRLSRLLGYIALYAAACLLVVALVYKFDIGLYWAGLSATLNRLDAGRSSFVMDRYTVDGVWWYFPLAAALKTPLLVLLAAATGVWAAAKKFRRDYLWLLLPPAVFFAAALTAKVQIGYRHVMPVMPFLAALAGLALARLAAADGRRAWLAGIIAVLIPVSALTAHPHYLAYFNQLAGGPANGYKYFVDSNLDWGQDVKTLAAYLAGRGNPPVVFAYFGTARPEAYGIKYAPLGLVSNVEMRGTGERVCGMRPLLAVSATNLQGTYYPDKNSFAWLKAREPVFSAGHSIFLYDLAGDREGISSLAALFDREGRNEEADCLYALAGGDNHEQHR